MLSTTCCYIPIPVYASTALYWTMFSSTYRWCSYVCMYSNALRTAANVILAFKQNYNKIGILLINITCIHAMMSCIAIPMCNGLSTYVHTCTYNILYN